jgi:hypothetical protein
MGRAVISTLLLLRPMWPLRRDEKLRGPPEPRHRSPEETTESSSGGQPGPALRESARPAWIIRLMLRVERRRNTPRGHAWSVLRDG